MSDSEAGERLPKRQKRDTNRASKAFDKFKELRSGKRNKYEMEELESVYETVDEREYVKRVLDRQDDDWIVDDDGSGYVEDGRDIFDDDLDSESIAQATSKGKGAKRKKKNVSDNAGKGNLQAMISNMPAKKKQEVKIDDDDMLSEILGEIDDESLSPESKSSQNSFVSRKQVAQDYLKTFSRPPVKTKKTPIRKLNQNKPSISGVSSPIRIYRNELDNLKIGVEQFKFADNGDKDVKADVSVDIESKEKETNKENIEKVILYNNEESLTIEDIDSQKSYSTQDKALIIDDDFTQDDDGFDDLDLSQIEEIESQAEQQMEQNLKSIVNGFDTALYDSWTQHNSEAATPAESTVKVDMGDIPLVTVNDKKVFRFYWWDAFEDQERQRGTVFLFGKTYCEKTNAFVSCCVAVRNISRQVFVLPRPFKLDRHNQETDQAVEKVELYKEFNDLVVKPLNIGEFKTRFVSKKYAFDPFVPTESDYMEVQYSAKEPRINPKHFSTTPKTFSKIFGLNTSFLERLLMDRKMMGPCWLEISDPVAVTNPVSWCKYEVNCTNMSDILKSEAMLPAPPLVVSSLNFRNILNPKTLQNEIVMISCVTQTKYAVDKQAPDPFFDQHFCVLAPSSHQRLPPNIHEHIKTFKKTKLQKMDSEKALIQYFINQFSRIDPDLIVGHDLHGYQMSMFANRLQKNHVTTFDKLGRLKRSDNKKLDKEIFLGRLVCDIKISAKELIKSRTYDLDALCQSVLKINETQRVDLESDEIPKMFATAQDILKLVTYTMQDSAFILKIMFDLNIIPLSLQITCIAGNVMSKTLLGGRSERNEYLLLHAFTEKSYIVPDKQWKKKNTEETGAAKKKGPSYAGGLVLEPKVGFYDTLILLMDFNSLYPSIIQEYNICFTTLPITNTEENLVLPDRNLPPGILPVEIKKLVQSRRQVKSLMKEQNLNQDLKMQYNIRQTALKLTANSMYGCLGFSNSRFYAKNLAALVTQKGREILTNTKDLVEKMCYEVVYGDTDSIMINTNILDYAEVFKIGVKIKAEINKLYKQVELDIDGVFKYLLLLKKKKYAAVTLTKTPEGKLKEEKEYKGIDIVRRDWSHLACESGKYVLEHILSDQPQDERIQNIHQYLTKIKEDLMRGDVPIQLLIITKQLTKDPGMYVDKNSLAHVQVALRYNKKHGGHFRAGDTVPYVICQDGSDRPATQRAYHPEELKYLGDQVKIDYNYYLSQQVHPVVTRICEPIPGTGACEIAECLGLDVSSFKKSHVKPKENIGENEFDPEVRFRESQKFVFKCIDCKTETIVDGPFRGNVPVLEKCLSESCNTRPIDHLYYIQNQLMLQISKCISKYYQTGLICEDPGCPNVTTRLPLRFVEKYPVCTLCGDNVMFREYTEKNLYTQLSYYLYIFSPAKSPKKNTLLEEQTKEGYQKLQDTVTKYLNNSGYSRVDLTSLFNDLNEVLEKLVPVPSTARRDRGPVDHSRIDNRDLLEV